MDTQKDKLAFPAPALTGLTGQQLLVGAKQIRKALKNGTVRQVYLAANADPVITEPIALLCAQGGVAYAWVKSMSELGQACGIEVGATAAAVRN